MSAAMDDGSHRGLAGPTRTPATANGATSTASVLRGEVGRPTEAPHATRRGAIVGEIEALIREYFDREPPDTGLDCPLALPLYGAAEVVGAVEALLAQEVTMGTRVAAFERAFAEYIGCKHALMVNSGSSANLLALAALSAQPEREAFRPGDEVIVPAVTWSTSVAPILQTGCVPVFVDVDLRTLNLKTGDLEEARSSRTRGIMPVHLLGNPVDMDPLTAFARESDLWVLEDTCEALGTSLGDRRVGSIGDVGTFSFFFSHHITTIEGGMLVTDDDRLANTARSIRSHGWIREMDDRAEIEAANPAINSRFLFAHVGFNLRPMETQGAFGLVQLQRLEGFNAARRAQAHRILAGLEDLADEIDFVTEQPGGRSTWFGLAVLLKDRATREGLSRHLQERQIDTRPILAGNLAMQPAFRDLPHRTVGSLPNATAITERGLYIGNHPGMSERRLEHIIESFRSFYR